MVPEYRTGQWDIASLCVVHIGIVLCSPMAYYGTRLQDSGIASLCVVHIEIVLYSPMAYYGTRPQDRTVGFS